MTPNLSSSPLSTTVPCSVPSALPEACSEGSHTGWPRSQANWIDDPCAHALMFESLLSAQLLFFAVCQNIMPRRPSPCSPLWMGLFQGVQKSMKVTDSGRMDTHHYCTHPCFLKKIRQRNSRVVKKVVGINKCILTESSDRGDSILVRT